MKCSMEILLVQKIVIEISGLNTKPYCNLGRQCNFKIPTVQTGKVSRAFLILDCTYGRPPLDLK